MMIHCFIVDDEEHALQFLSGFITDTPGLLLEGSSTHPLDLLQTFNDTTLFPKVLFADIDMPQLTGLELARIVSDSCPVIFTTAYSDFAVSAFDENACDFLLKPFTYQRFLSSIQKCRDMILAKALLQQGVKEEDYLYVQMESKAHLVKIRISQILFVESLHNYIRIATSEGKFVTYLTMQEIEQRLPPDKFFRVHKSFIVNHDKVQAVHSNHVYMDDGEAITMGREFRQGILHFIQTKLLKSRRANTRN